MLKNQRLSDEQAGRCFILDIKNILYLKLYSEIRVFDRSRIQVESLFFTSPVRRRRNTERLKPERLISRNRKLRKVLIM